MNNLSSSTKFDDDSTSPVQTHALQLALKTMNERCQQLQQRLVVVEEENMKLKSLKSPRNDTARKSAADYDELREKVEELTRQKNQLVQHINMVAGENRHLWTRLSKMTKDNHSLNSQSPKLMDSIEQPPQKNHIIRSKTFTQSTPNSKLCPKINSDSDISLEEISLKLINNFIQDKSVLEEQYEQMIEMHSDIDSDEQPTCLDLKNIGFSYITDSNDDSGVVLNQCMDEFKQVKEQVLEQKNCLNDLLSVLRNKNKDKLLCNKCKSSLNLNSTVYKDCANETKWATPVSSTPQFKDPDASHHNLFRPISDDNLDIDSAVPAPVQEGEVEENYDTLVSAVCPMCQECFTNTSLNELTDHVEKHFCEENDTTIDSNFEIVTGTIGNF